MQYLTTHNTHKRQTSMPPVGFEPTIPASERPQTYALDRAATETGSTYVCIYVCVCVCMYVCIYVYMQLYGLTHVGWRVMLTCCIPSEEESTKLIAVRIQDPTVFVQPAGRFGSQP